MLDHLARGRSSRASTLHPSSSSKLAPNKWSCAAGLTPRGITELFNILDRDSGKYTFSVSCYMLELYQDDLQDLLLQVPKGTQKVGCQDGIGLLRSKTGALCQHLLQAVPRCEQKGASLVLCVTRICRTCCSQSPEGTQKELWLPSSVPTAL